MSLEKIEFKAPKPLPIEVVFERKANRLEKRLFKLVPKKQENIYDQIRRRSLAELKTQYENLALEISMAANPELKRKFINKFQMLNKNTSKGKALKKINEEYKKTIRSHAKLKK